MLRPIEDKVVIKKIDNPESAQLDPDMMTGGIPNMGEIMAVGPGMVLPDGTRTEAEVKVGDTIYFAPYSGNEIVHNGAHYVVMPHRDIFAVVED